MIADKIYLAGERCRTKRRFNRLLRCIRFELRYKAVPREISTNSDNYIIISISLKNYRDVTADRTVNLPIRCVIIGYALLETPIIAAYKRPRSRTLPV